MFSLSGMLYKRTFQSGATELSVRMVESVGAKRQDIVFDMGCDSIEEVSFVLWSHELVRCTLG